MERIVYMVLMDLLHTPIRPLTITCMAREEDTKTAAEKYGHIPEMVKGISRRGKVTITTAGTEYIPSENGSTLFPNHQGLFDILTLFPTCPKPLSVVIEREASNWILVKQVLGATKNLTMNRDDIKDQVRIITEVTKLIKSGRNFVMSAEGHRNRNGSEILDFKSGAFKDVAKVDYPIVSVTSINPLRSFDMNSLKREGVQVRYMKSIPPDQYVEAKTSEITYLMRGRIQEEIDKNPTQDDLAS